MTERYPGASPEMRRRRADPRLPAYLVAGFGGLIGAVATARPELAALGAPFLVLLALGIARRAPTGLRGDVRLADRRTVEGDLIEGEVTVDWDGEAEVDIVLSGGRGVEAVDPSPVVGWSLPPGEGPITLAFRLRARSWGVHEIGALWLRARRPRGYRVAEERVALAPVLRVLPSSLRLSRLLKPAEPRTFAGVHVSRLRGHGTDFAELRPYRPGDRMRDLSWGTSARLGAPWVRVSHPERTGTVVLFLDTVFSESEASTEALARAARAAWAVASVHLRAQDRVGLIAQGRTAAWLPPRDGRRARLMLLDELLAVGRAAEEATHPKRHRRRVHVPADALIVGVTRLRSQTVVPSLLHYRRVGHATVALVIDTSDLLPDNGDHLDATARRIWLAQRDAERRTLERGGIPTAMVEGGDGVGPAVLGLRRRMNGLLQPSRVARVAL